MLALDLRAAVLKLAKTAITDANPAISTRELRNKIQGRIYGSGGYIKNSSS